MYSRILMPVSAALLAVLAIPASAVTEDWETDVEAAQALARADEKDLLVYFTSSDGCAWCRVLERVVLDTEEFKQAREHFLLVKLDLPFGESELSADARERNSSWQQRWGADVFPTIVLADAEARPFGMLVGHAPGGPQAVLRRLDEARAAKGRRDELFATAEKAPPAERARLLSQALSALPLEQDILVRPYRTEIETIIADSADAAVRGHYRRLLSQVDDRQFQAEVTRRIDVAAGEYGDSTRAIAVLDEALADETLTESRRDWLLYRKAIYRWTEAAFAEAEAALDEALGGDDPREDPAQQLFLARVVFESGRSNEGTKRLDALADAFSDMPEWRWKALHRKADLLKNAGRAAEALAAADAAVVAAATPDNWVVSQWIRSEQLIVLGHAGEAADALRDCMVTIRQGEFPEVATIKSLLRLSDALASSGDTVAAKVAADSARRLLRRYEPELLENEEYATKLANYPPVEPVEAPRL